MSESGKGKGQGGPRRDDSMDRSSEAAEKQKEPVLPTRPRAPELPVKEPAYQSIPRQSQIIFPVMTNLTYEPLPEHIHPGDQLNSIKDTTHLSSL